MKETIIAGLDIGSTSIRLVVGQQVKDDNQLQIIGAVSVKAKGIIKGAVKSIEDVTSSISECLEKGERLVGIPMESVWISINSPYIKCEKSRGVVAVGKSDGEISQDDVERALEAARALSVPPNYEILHVIPIKFTVDSQDDIKDPIGMTGVRLEVETLIIQGLSSQIKNLTKAVFRTGLDIEDLVLSPLAAAEAVMDSEQKEEIDTSELFEDGEQEEEIGMVSKKYLAEIIEARVEEIFEKIDEEFKKIDRSGMLPGGVFLIGGGTRLHDLVNAAKKKLRLPVCLGANKKISTIIDKVNETEFLNALGLVVWGSQVMKDNTKDGFKIFGKDTVGKMTQKAKDWFSSLIP